MAQEGETLCLVCGNKPPVSIDNYQVIVKEKHFERILPEYSSLEDAWEMLKGVQFYREYKGKSNVFQWLNQSANVCFLCMDKVITLAVAVHDITSLLNAKEKDMQRRSSPVKTGVAPQNSTQPLEKQPPMGSSEDDSVIICEKSAKQSSSNSQQSRRRASQPPEVWITKKESSQNSGKQVAASKAGTKTVAKAVVPPTSRQPVAKAVVPPTSRQPAASNSNTRARNDIVEMLIIHSSNFDEEVILIHQTAPKDVILEQVVHKSSDREYFAPPTPTPTPSPEILQDNVKNGIRPADKDRRISFNTTTMSMPTKRTVVPTLKKRESMGVTHSTSALQNKNKSAVNESQPKEKLAGATGNLKQAGAADLQAGKRRINSEPPAVAAAADILPAKRARAPSAKMKEADGDGLWKKIAGSEEFNRANTVRTNKATRRSAPAPGTSATIMPKNPTVSTSKDVLEDWKSPEFRAQQLTKLNKVLNEGKWGIRSGDNMEKEVFKTAASKDAYMQGIANLVSHFGGQIPIFPAKDKQNKVVPKTTLQTKERRRSSIPRPNRVALGTFAGKEISVADSKNVTDKDVTRRKSIAGKILI